MTLTTRRSIALGFIVAAISVGAWTLLQRPEVSGAEQESIAREAAPSTASESAPAADLALTAAPSEQVSQPGEPRLDAAPAPEAPLAASAKPLVKAASLPAPRTTLDLRFPDGTQPDVATIRTLRHESGRRIFAPEDWSKDQPELKQRDAVRSIEAYADVFPNTRGTGICSRWISAELKLDELAPPNEVIRVDLEPRQILSVTVLDEGDEASATPWVRVAPSEGFDVDNPRKSFDAYESKGGFPQHRYGQVTPGLQRIDGVFREFDLEPGAWTVGVGRLGALVDVVTEVNVGVGETELQIALPAPTGADLVRVRVTDESGDPIQSVRFSLQYEEKGRTFGSNDAPAEFRDGAYWIGPAPFQPPTQVRPQDADKLQWTLFIESYRYGTQSTPVVPGQTDYVFVMRPPGELTVRAKGTPPGTLWVRAVPSDRKGRGSSQGLGSSMSTALKLQPGDYRIDLIHATEGRNRNRWRFVVAQAEVHVKQGPSSVELDVPELFDLVVTAPNLRPGSTLKIQRTTAGQRGNFARLDAENRVTFEALPAGEYLLSTFSGKGEETVTVPVSEFVYQGK